MIELTCGDCGGVYSVPETRAGAMAMCPTCGLRNHVPGGDEPEQAAVQQPVGAAAAGGAPPRFPGPGGHPVGPPPGDLEPAADQWIPGGMDVESADARPLDPFVEDDQRRANLFRIGLAMAVAFFAPIVGIPGKFLVFPELGGFPGLTLAGLVLLLPLIAGVATMAVARTAQPPLRGAVLLGAGLALFALFLIDGDARRIVKQAINTAPGSVTISTILMLAGFIGLFVGARARSYRPGSAIAFTVGAVGAVAYALYLLIPSGGSMPIVAPFEAFKISKLGGVAMLAHVGLMLGAAFFCLKNTTATLPLDAAANAGLAFRCLAGAMVVPFVLTVLGFVSMGAGQMLLPALTSAVKYGVMFGGLLLLVPIGITDLLVGRP